MKRLERSDKSIEHLKLFAQDSQRRGIGGYDAESIRRFADDIGDGLTDSVSREHRLRGLRAETLFQVVATSLGRIELIKEEDSGETYFSGDDIQVPDYRVVVDGRHFLIEVKAQQLGEQLRQLKLSDSYMRRLRCYCELMKGELRMAVFWEEPRLWTLNSLEAFTPGEEGKKWKLSFTRAMATNEMRLLGDATVGTLAPLRFRVELDPNKSVPEGEEGSFTVAVRRVSLLSQNTPLTGQGARIAWKLIWYGPWVEGPQESHHENGVLRWVDHLLTPPEWSGNQREPALVAPLSQLVTNAYLEGAQGTVHTTATSDLLAPGYMESFIPEDFVSLNLDLPLYMFKLQPNFAFVESEK